MHIGYWWALVGLLFLLIEIGTPGLFFFVSFAIGSFGSSIIAFLGYSFNAQCITTLIVTIIAFFVLKKRFTNNTHHKLSTNIDALIGCSSIVLKQVGPNSSGLVKVKGETWRAAAPANTTLPEGATVIVQTVKGNTVIVVQKS